MADPLRRQARSDTRLRYGQTLADLLSARRTNYHQYQNDVSTAEDTARAVRQAAKESVPQLKAIYDEADQTRSAAAAQIDAATNLASTPHSALAMALKGERGASTQRFASERAAAQSDAVTRGQEATAGLAYAKKNALENFRTTRGDLLGKTRDTHSDMRAFEQSRLGELQDAQAKSELDATNQARSDSWKRGIDPDTGLPTLDARKKIADLTGKDPVTGKPIPGKGPRGRSQAEQRQVGKDTSAASAQIKLARTWIKRLTKGNSLPKVVELLTTGGSIPHTEEFTGRNAAGQPVKKSRQVDIPVPAIDNPDFLKAAIELEKLGHLSDSTIHNLRTIQNVHIPKSWLPKKFALSPGFRPEITTPAKR